jgi:ATP-dependent Lon protease
VPFDLSKVMFIATANMLDTIPGRCATAWRSSAARLHPSRRSCTSPSATWCRASSTENGLAAAGQSLQDDGGLEIISSYTREAGVRNLEREIGGVCRKVARDVAEAKNGACTVKTRERVHDLLGPAHLHRRCASGARAPGVATGLAWTPVGGDILFIEATSMPGKGRLTLTGQLGDVMKESAMAALSYVRALAATSASTRTLQSHDVHIHVPAGAIPKDGPSAGVTMATADLLARHRARRSTATWP